MKWLYEGGSNGPFELGICELEYDNCYFVGYKNNQKYIVSELCIFDTEKDALEQKRKFLMRKLIKQEALVKETLDKLTEVNEKIIDAC